MFGYLKKVTRIDTCRGQESVRTMSAQENSVTPAAAAVLPQMRLMAPSTTSLLSGRSSAPPSPNVFFCEPVKSRSSTCSACDENLEKAGEEGGEGEIGEEGEEEDASSSSKGRKRRVHLLPSSFLSLLPPGTPHSSSGRSSSSSGFKSRPNSVSDEQTSICSAKTDQRSPARRVSRQKSNGSDKKSSSSSHQRKKGSSSVHAEKRGQELSHRNDQQNQQQHQQQQQHQLPLANTTSRRSSSRSPRATTPTTFCPTIASALWRPLWPPGWHPRSSPNAPNIGGEGHISHGYSVTTAPVPATRGSGRGAVAERCTTTPLSTNTTQLHHPQTSSSSPFFPTVPTSSASAALQLRTSTVDREISGRRGLDKMTEASNGGKAAAPPTSEQQQRVHRSSHSSSRKGPTTIGPNTAGSGAATATLLTASNGEHACEDIFLEENYEKIEDWLDEHPAFVQSYFLRKVSRPLVDQWLVTHSTSTGTLGKSACATTSSKHLIFLDHHPLTACKTRRHRHSIAYSQVPTTLSANQTLTSTENSGANTPVRKISAHEFEASGGGFLRPMVSTTFDGTPTFLPIQQDNAATKLTTTTESQSTAAAVGFEQLTTTATAAAAVGVPSSTASSVTTPGATATPQSATTAVKAASGLAKHQQQHHQHHQSSSLARISPTSGEFGILPSLSSTSLISSNTSSSSMNTLTGSTQLGTVSASSSTSTATATPSKNPSFITAGARIRHASLGGPLISFGSNVSGKSREEIEAINNENELIFELVKDICNDLDVRSLCHKILKNVSILTNADRCSLFIVRGEKNEPKTRYLASHLFDVSGQSTIEQVSLKEEITIPWGKGIVGHVAESGKSVNIPDCYKDAHFSSTIDQKTGYTTRNMLCNPIVDVDGTVLGVAQVINKNGAPCFTASDEAVFARYLQFCGIGLRNAQLYELSQLENRRNQVLLDLARMIFEKQSTIENIIFRILVHTLSLLQCERAQILLLTEETTDGDFYYYGRTYQDPYGYFNMTTTQARIANDCGLTSSSEGQSVGGSTSSTIATTTTATTTSSTSSSNASNADSETSPVPPVVGGNSPGGRSSFSFTRVFDLARSDVDKPDFEKLHQTPFEGRFPINVGVTGYVASTGETLNIADAYADPRFDAHVDDHASNEAGFRHRGILCMPIRNASRKIIGVAQLVNKLNGQPFNMNDINIFEGFAIFSGMGIENTQMFEKAVKAMAKQRVTLELLSYHASATDQEAAKFAYDLQRMMIPSTSSLCLDKLHFRDFSLTEDQMIRGVIRMFLDLDLIERFHIDYKVLCKWILSVRKNYRPVLYHNWRHAFNVAQFLYAILVNTNLSRILGELETLALIVACLSHDLDHRGTNNSFQIKTSSPLAQLYSTSTLEHHHFDQSLMILNSQGNQILSNLSPEEYRHVVSVLEEAILATDLAVYFRKRDAFFELVNREALDWGNDVHRSLLRSMLMTACDIAAITKPWEVQKVVAELVASEFFQQGDIEKAQLKIEPIDMMNREKREELPKMQLSFISSICLPVYESFAKLFPNQLTPLVNGVLDNRQKWTTLSSMPYQLSIKSPVSSVSPYGGGGGGSGPPQIDGSCDVDERQQGHE